MTRAAHLIRPPTQQPRRRVREQASTEYAPGHFLALVKRHNWPPMFEARMSYSNAPDWSAISTTNRMAQVEKGNTGTLLGMGLAADPSFAGWVAGQPETMA